MTQALPASMKIGRYKYTYSIDPTLPCYGRVFYEIHRIKILPRKPVRMRESFWHETTHAVLWEMGRRDLALDEGFVKDFSRTLSRAIDSAEFK